MKISSWSPIFFFNEKNSELTEMRRIWKKRYFDGCRCTVIWKWRWSSWSKIVNYLERVGRRKQGKKTSNKRRYLLKWLNTSPSAPKSSGSSEPPLILWNRPAGEYLRRFVSKFKRPRCGIAKKEKPRWGLEITVKAQLAKPRIIFWIPAMTLNINKISGDTPKCVVKHTLRRRGKERIQSWKHWFTSFKPVLYFGGFNKSRRRGEGERKY